MTELFNKKYLLNFLILPVFAIGGFYDRRIAIGDFNLTYLFTAFFVMGFLFVLNRSTNKVMKNHFIFFIFFLFFF